MAPITTIEHLGQFEGQEVTLRGWLYNLRESGKLLFPIFRDGTGLVQGVMAKNAVAPEMFETVKGLTQESSVIIHGKVRADKRAPGGFELDLASVEVVQKVSEETPYPISLKDHGVEFLMEHRHLWLRSPRQVAILRIRSEIERAMHDFFYARGLYPDRSADSDSGGMRRDEHAVSGGLLRGAGLSDAVRAALH